MRRLVRCWLPFLLVAACVLGGGPRATSSGTYEDRLAAFKSTQRSASLAIRTQGQEQLAASKDRRAIEVLARLYASPRSPKNRARHLIVSVLARHFDDAAFTDDFARLRKKHAKARDAWLWFRTLVIHGKHGGVDTLWATVRDPELPAPLRAAAVEAAVELAQPGVADLVPEVLAALPRGDADCALLVQALATALLGVRDRAEAHALSNASDALMAHLETPLVSESTRVVVGRVLRQLLDARFTYLDGKDWREHLERPSVVRKSDARRLQEVRCAGEKSLGLRIAYVIDVSSGATQPVTEEESTQLLDTTEAIPSRLALMQRAVRVSIRALKPEQSFVVLYHAHHGVGALADLGRLVPATPENKKKAIAALDAIPIGGPADLHAGLGQAYRVHTGGSVEEGEHLAAETILGGCDTAFLFAHSPSRVDRWTAKDPEKRLEPVRTLPSGGTVQGLFADPVWLGEEVLRWRAFRKLKLFCVAFGDAHADLLGMVARSADGFWPRTAAQRAADIAKASAGPDPKFLEAKETYRAYLKRPSLKKRTKGREQFAATRSLLALEQLARDYASVEAPAPLVQQLIVDICCQWFQEKQALPIFARWRGRHGTRVDAWLWHRTFMADLEHDKVRAALRTAAEAHDPFLRAAAMRAAAKQREAELLLRVPEWTRAIRESSAQGLDRNLPIEAMASVLCEMSSAKDDDVYKDAALALLDAFDDEATPHRTKLTIVRNLAAGLDVPPEGLHKNTWVREVRAGGSGVGMADHRYGAPTFGGLRASGTRICYVIDMSDSMLTPLEPHERLRPKVVTGAPGARKRRPEDEVNWAKIKNRFDLARALLITSLQSLRPNTHFCVIWFGSKAGTLKTTKGLVPTTPENVKRTVKEIRAIKPGRPGEGEHKTNVEWGSLRGETNLHGGLTRALTRTADEVLSGYAYVSGVGLADGCDTIFLLSDGAPTTDDFVQVDKRDPDDHAVEDRETMKRTADTPELTYPGPYGNPRQTQHLLNDIERRNLFRQVEIHCLGIGDANMALLQRLARLGLGESRKIGDDKQEK